MNENNNIEILNDEKITEELVEKLSGYESKLGGYESKKRELNSTLADLNKKNTIEDISESTKEKIGEVIGKVQEKIGEVDSEIEELTKKINQINETLNPTPEAPVPPIPPVPPVPPFPETTANENKVRELENRRSQKETERSELETKRSEAETSRNSGDHELDAQIEMIEKQQNRLKETAGTIEEKMNEDNINTATYERLEEMHGEVWEKIDELQEKTDELQEKIDDYWDGIIDGLNDKIDELQDEIDEICDEIEDLNGTVDEDIINEVKKSSGFDDLSNLLNKITDNINTALFNVKIPDIKIPPIPEIKIRIPGQNFSQPASAPEKNRDRKYGVNFASNKMGARIHSFCCEHSHQERAVNLLRDDPDYNEKWCAADNHGKFKTVKPHWVIVDFGAIKTFNYLKMVKCSPGRGHRDDTGNKNYDASAWTFEISNDKEHWVEFNSETSDYSAIYEKNFGTLTGRYVRLHIEAGGSDPKNKHHGVRLYELRFEMRDALGIGDVSNLCAGASIESCCHGDWGAPVTNLIRTDDPDYHNKWYTEHAHEEKVQNSHWVIIDLGEARTFNQIKIAKASVGKHDLGDKHKDMSAWCAEVSSDMSNWTVFNYEKNDRSAVYEKSFEPQTGRYIRLWVDAAESDPNDRHGHVRLYGISLEMTDKGDSAGEVTFDDIIAIAPFAKKETLDKLVDKLIATDDLNKVKSLAPFLSQETLNKLISKVSGKADINTIKSLAPFLSRETLDRFVDELDEEMDFEKIKALAPFLSRDALAKCVVRSGGKLDMKRLRSLAPFLGSDVIDEIISKML